MSRRALLIFSVLVGIQAAFPLGVVAWNEWKLHSGTDVRLKTAPVDPVDLFRGRYITLSYEISNLLIAGEAEEGDTVYVILHREGDRWTGTQAGRERPSDQATFIKGRVRSGAGGSRGLIEYGIETYYTDEDVAPELERGSGVLYVDVALDDDGTARIKDIEPAE